MRLIAGGRRTGKTSELIKYAAANNAYIVCRSVSMCKEIASMAHDMNLVISFPLTYQEFLEKKYYGKFIHSFCIDDIDLFLQSLTNVPIEMVTFTGGIKRMSASSVSKKSSDKLKQLPGQLDIEEVLKSKGTI